MPYGYRVNGDGRTLHPYEPERAIVGVIETSRKQGVSLRAIADQLNDAGFRTRTGTPWRFEYVRSVLHTLTRNATTAG